MGGAMAEEAKSEGILESKLDGKAPRFSANRVALLALLGGLREQETRDSAGRRHQGSRSAAGRRGG